MVQRWESGGQLFSEGFVPIGVGWCSMAASPLGIHVCALTSAAFGCASAAGEQTGSKENQGAQWLFVAVFWKALLPIKIRMSFFCHFTGFLNEALPNVRISAAGSGSYLENLCIKHLYGC